jgi:hypothetical protein
METRVYVINWKTCERKRLVDLILKEKVVVTIFFAISQNDFLLKKTLHVAAAPIG